jgi:transposase
MPKRHDRASKRQFLRQHGTLNPHSQDVVHQLFREQEFFDPEDLLQVKYEMLRQVRVDKQAIQPTARSFGLSRPSFYQAQRAFGKSGLAGLLPQRRGPRQGHKLTSEVMQFVTQTKTADPSQSLQQLARAVKEKFDILVHPRSIARQWQRQKKTP